MTATLTIVQWLLVIVLAVSAGFLAATLAWWPKRDHMTAYVPKDDPRLQEHGLNTAGRLALRRTALLAAPPRPGEPAWPDHTYSEIYAGFDQLERNVCRETAPMRKYLP